MSVESCFVIHVYEIDYRLGEKVTWISFPPMPAVCNKIEKTANKKLAQKISKINKKIDKVLRAK